MQTTFSGKHAEIHAFFKMLQAGQTKSPCFLLSQKTNAAFHQQIEFLSAIALPCGNGVSRGTRV